MKNATQQESLIGRFIAGALLRVRVRRATLEEAHRDPELEAAWARHRATVARLRELEAEADRLIQEGANDLDAVKREVRQIQQDRPAEGGAGAAAEGADEKHFPIDNTTPDA
jgi:hypothetical protein